MIVIVLSKCSPSLRGDLTKWLFEVSTNIFVGRVGARVRDQLWKRIEQCCESGRATMAFSTNNEQHFDFRVHNTEWEPIDIDGFKLMIRPLTAGADSDALENGYSKASRYMAIKQRTNFRKHNGTVKETQSIEDENSSLRYVVIDLETTGLSAEKDVITQLNAMRVSENGETD